MVYRIYVEKKPGFDVEANGLKNELTGLLGIRSLTGLRLLNRFVAVFAHVADFGKMAKGAK